MFEPIITKYCSKCKKIKLISEFYKNLSRKDNLSNWCKSCNLANDRKYRQTEKGKLVHRQALLKYFHSEKGKAYQKQYCQSETYKKARYLYNRSKKRKIVYKRYEQSKKGKESHRQNATNYRSRHPEIIRAHSAVARAIKAGILPYPNSLICSCGEIAQHYHHPSYVPEHWLDVVPVCIPCHNSLI